MTSIPAIRAVGLGVQVLLFLLYEVVCTAASDDSLVAMNQSAEIHGSLPSFRDITDEAGLAYKITCGDQTTQSLVDVNGQGACFLDYDGDGLLDLYLANGSSQSLDHAGTPPHDYLLSNQGDGTFSDVTRIAGLGDEAWSSGCAVGDYDNDGDPDIYLTNYGPNKLYRNEVGYFSDVSAELDEILDERRVVRDGRRNERVAMRAVGPYPVKRGSAALPKIPDISEEIVIVK